MKLAFVILTSLLSLSAFADKTVRCATDAKKPVPVLEYTIRDMPSMRLTSGVIVTNNGTQDLIFPQFVAQYGAAKEAIYFLADNEEEIPTHRLYAVSAKGGYAGTFSYYKNGKISKNIAVKCAITAR